MWNQIWPKLATIRCVGHFAVWTFCFLFCSIQLLLSACRLHKYSHSNYYNKVKRFSRTILQLFSRILDNGYHFDRSNLLWKHDLDHGTKRWERKTRITIDVYKDFINKWNEPVPNFCIFYFKLKSREYK